MTTFPANLLERPVQEGARLIALAFLDDASAALPRLDDADDTEALHDFRVSIRRMRSTLRAYRRHLKGSHPRRLSRWLRKLQQATKLSNIGIIGMRERIESLGGKFSIKSAPKKGTEISIRVPVKGKKVSF